MSLTMEEDMKKKISVLFLTLMMVVGLLPFSSINVSAQESELIINDSEVGQELHQFKVIQSVFMVEMNIGLIFNVIHKEIHYQVMKLNLKELVLNYMVKNNLN